VIPQGIPSVSGRPAASAVNREQWLTHIAMLLRPWFLSHGVEIPVRVRLGVGALAFSSRTLGVCYPQVDRAGFRHVTISPFIDDPVLVAAVLAHELIHAGLPPDELHGSRFRAVARSVGFQGRLAEVTPGPEFQSELVAVAQRAGTYPHVALVADLSA
jgi:hypothetical protein